MAGADGGEVAYLELSDFHEAAVEALGVDIETARRITNDTLAGSALAAPAAGFGDFEKYPDFATKVAVLLQAITSNHALPDGNKRTALLCAIVFAGINGFRWDPPPGDEHDGAETARIVEAAAAGTIPLEDLRDWISQRLVAVSET
jgi:death-on-curing protein